MEDQELEVKLYVHDLGAIEGRLLELGAGLVQPRTHEFNLRFDTPAGDLSQGFRVLRLRQDTAARLTYKGPARTQDGVRVRQEIEFTVGDFRAARAFLEVLGFQVSMIYEKYRTIYEFEGVHITLDELPYGNFVEIEGPSVERIRAVNLRLDLDWQAGISESYAILFERLRNEMGLEFRDLIFDNFSRLELAAKDLNVKPADVI
jgi:adenylate cyclase class 2